jgi:hypothetical protein
MTSSSDELPDGFTFDDFLAALDAVDAPADQDLPTDGDGCVELVTLPVRELGAALARLREAGMDPHVELPDDDEKDGTAAVFVPLPALSRARRILGIAT